MTKEYREALTEVNEILKFCDINIVKKIPCRFKKFVEDNMNTDYKFEMDLSKSINQQNITKQTQYILAMIYKDYICDEDKKEKIKKYQINRNKIIEEKYNPDNLFVNKRIQKNNKGICTDLMLKQKETIIGKIKKIFKRILKG
mgnify:FL=1